MHAQQPALADGGANRCKGVLRRLCCEIMSPSPAKPAALKRQGAAGVKGAMDRGLVSALKRGAVPRWVLSHSSSRSTARGATGNCYADSSDCTSCSTLVGSMLTAGTDAAPGGSDSVGQQDPRPMAMRGQQELCTQPHMPKATPSPHPMPQCAPCLAPRPDSSMEAASHRRFILGRNPQFTGVLDVISAWTDQVVYRRIIHRSKLWCASLHSVPSCNRAARCDIPCATFDFGRRDMPPDIRGGAHWSPRSPMSYCAGNDTEWTAAPSFAPTPLASASSCDQRMGMWQYQQQHPRAYEKSRLWEISSPQPGVFPLHCRDTRGVLDPVPLTPMVLDRHQFCYRFYLAGHKMRWQAKVQGRVAVELQCYVRSSVVALLLFNGSSVWPGRPWSKALRSDSACASSSGSTMYDHSGSGHPRTSPYSDMASIVILPAAFSKLATVDSAIVESFVLFTGIVVYECLVYSS